MSCATNEYYLWLVYIGYAINSSSIAKQHILTTSMNYIESNTIIPGADLRFSERGDKHSSGSLKQGSGDAAPQKLYNYRIFCFVKYRNAT